MKIMKVLFVDIFTDDSPIDESVGHGSISAVLRLNDYKTKLVAYNESEIDYEEIANYKPDIIGFSVQPRTISIVNSTSEKLSQILPEAIQVIGGYLATNCPDEILKCMNKINIALRGEGEYTFLSLIEAINNKRPLELVEGVSFMRGDEVIHNNDRQQIEDLDSLPYPDRDIIEKYNINTARVEGARGCTSACSFCSIHGFWSNGHKENCVVWRGKSVKRFVDEIEFLVNQYGITKFHFLDSSYENPYYNSNRIKEIAEEIISRNLNISYYVNMRADFHRIATDDLMSLLVNSGLNTIFIGIESFNEQDLRLYSKSATVEDGIRTINVLKKYSIRTDIGFINFHPYTTIDNLYNNAIHLHKFGFSSRLLLVNKLMVFKGTTLYQKMKRDKLFESEFYEIKDYKYIDNKVAIVDSYIENYIKRTNDSNDGILNKLDIYEHRHWSLISHLKHYFSKLSDGNALSIVDKYEEDMSILLDELNDRNTKWFIGILDIVKGEWDEYKADQIMKMYIGEDYLIDLLKKFNSNNLILYRNIIKIRKEYARLL